MAPHPGLAHQAARVTRPWWAVEPSRGVTVSVQGVTPGQSEAAGCRPRAPFAIDESELHRVSQVSGKGAGSMLRSVPGETDGTTQATLRVERDRLLAEREDLRETIRDLRHRLDSEVDERRRLLALLTAPERRPWWRRWFR